MRKRDRQQLIETLIRQRDLSTQSQLVKALKAEGCDITQATVSRDMREIGVQKGAGEDGRARYVIPPRRRSEDPMEIMVRVLRDSTATAREARNLVVVRSQPGTAPTVGRVIDESGREDVVGTVAGDDTVLMVMVDEDRATDMAKFINNIVQGRDQR